LISPKVKRKLAAILSADVQGYSRLMGEDEEGTIRTLKAHLEVISGHIQQRQGRIVATGGDSVLAEFASVVDAVRCAVEIQKELRERNRTMAEGRRLEFRMGVNLGDVVEEGDDILGDGVNYFIDEKELLGPHHPNPDHLRWELHRVWVVEGLLKEGKRHNYSLRRYYIDEDSWLILAADNYDLAASSFELVWLI
jgi:hypothetical protein